MISVESRERNERVLTYCHKVLNTIGPHVDTSIILSNGQSMRLQPFTRLMINMELRVLDDILLDNCNVQPDLGMGSGPAVTRVSWNKRCGP